MGERYNDSEGKTVFVGKLDFGATEDDLRDMFEKYGKIDRGLCLNIIDILPGKENSWHVILVGENIFVGKIFC